MSENEKHDFKVRIVYNSGHVEEHWFESFKVDCSFEKVTKFEYRPVPNSPFPLYIGAANIESIYQIDSRKRKVNV